MSKSKNDYHYTERPEPHVGRTKEIIKKHPEIKNLMGRNPNSIFYIVGIVAFQILVAFLLRSQPWWLIVILAYIVGAFANHALFVFIHECTHNLVLKGRISNIWAGILCDLAGTFPSSVPFRKYHLKHHAFQGHYDLDADIPSRWEAYLIGKKFVGKAIWLLFFPIFQGLRPARLREIQFHNKWTWINLAIVVLFDVLIVLLFGPMALLYLFLSFFFSIGLHPVGARWVQEHYLVAPPQETYSYYGPLNLVSFNVGYHNEHHDFSFIPWNKLPVLKKMAPEYYDTLVSHKSWLKLLWKFLTDSNITLFSRMLRENRGGINVSAKAEKDFAESVDKRDYESHEIRL